jgi:hypothetical protein
MNIPIRMIGIATLIFWVFLILFSATAAYSAKDLQFNFGEPQAGLTADNNLLFSLPITIANRGLYNIGHFNVTSTITDRDGVEITRGSTFIPVIRKSEEIATLHNMTLDIDRLLDRDHSFLFNDTELMIHEAVGLTLAEVIPVQASASFTMPWGAPLYNLKLGEPAYSPVNLTHFLVTVPISFENRAFFDVSGNLRMRMYDSADLLLGEGQTSIVAPQHSPYDGIIAFYIQLSSISPIPITPSGHFEVYFTTQLFNYGPLVIPYG